MTGVPEISWIDSANDAASDFPLANLPYGVFSRPDEPARCGVALGDMIVDLSVLEAAGLLSLSAAPVFDQPALNAFMALGRKSWDTVRARLTSLFSAGGDPILRDDARLRERALCSARSARMHLPFNVAGYTDFYSGRHHAENVGTMFRGSENALPPNWLSLPIGYNGRASTVVVSGTDIRRPWGQIKPAGVDLPAFMPSRRLDIELELGAVVGTPSQMGVPVSVSEAADMIFGYVLLNDWSARDIQAWEYQPLGPFLAKSFASTLSCWIVTPEALAPGAQLGMFDSGASMRLWAVVLALRARRAVGYVPLSVVGPADKEGCDALRTLMVEDTGKFGAKSYVDLLCHVHTEIQKKLVAS